jgi:hypothetical protein
VTSWDDEVLLRGDANSSIAQRETAREKRYLEEKRRKHRKNPQKKKIALQEKHSRIDFQV